jgi:hypothetical protein
MSIGDSRKGTTESLCRLVNTTKSSSFAEDQTSAQSQCSTSIRSTRRRFVLTATAAATYTSMGTQTRAHAAIVQTPVNLPPLPLPTGIRSRYVRNINGLPFTCWKLALWRRAGLACYSSMDIQNLPMVGAK